MNLTRAALLPIDMQQAFDGPPWPRRWNRQVDANGRRLLAAWRERGWPILHVRHDSIEPASTLRPGAPGHRPRPGFESQADEPVVAKTVNAAFIGTDLDLRLRRLGIDTVVTFGFSTDMCVSTTVRVGANLGFRMVVVADACDCFDLRDEHGGTLAAETVHAVHLATLRFDFAEIAVTDIVLQALGREADQAA